MWKQNAEVVAVPIQSLGRGALRSARGRSRADAHAAKAGRGGSSSKSKAAAANEAAAAMRLWGPTGYRPEMLLDYRGPLAALDDGRLKIVTGDGRKGVLDALLVSS